jgi:RNA polymerase sigma factor (sigma-70 family)
MSIKNPAFDTSLPEGNWFATTQWGLVVTAGGQATAEAAGALEDLCRKYWRPLYCYARRRGCSSHDAQDLTQEFFSRLVRQNYLHRVEREKGKFRSFMLGAFKNFLADEFDKANAAKRGGGAQFISLNTKAAEAVVERDAALHLSPEQTYDKHWVLTILDQAVSRLRKEYETAGKTELFQLIKPFLTESTLSGNYSPQAAQIGVTPNGFAVSVHRLRKRYREIVRLEVAATVSLPAEIDEEMKNLVAALGT